MLRNGFLVTCLSLICFSPQGSGIYNGTPIPANPAGMSAIYPSTVSYKITGPDFPPGVGRLCSGCRISPNRFLTAGHCLAGIQVANSRVEILSASGEKIADVQMKGASFDNYPATDVSGECISGDCSDVATLEISPTEEQRAKLDKHIDIAVTRPAGGEPTVSLVLTGGGCKYPQPLGGCGTGPDASYGFNEGRIYYRESTADGYKYSIDLGIIWNSGETTYLNFEEDDPLIGSGDSGGCAFDASGYVVGVNSHGSVLPVTHDSLSNVTTLRPTTVTAWLDGELRKECVVTQPESTNDVRFCHRPPPASDGDPSKKIAVVKLSSDVADLPACRKAESGSYCGAGKANEAAFACQLEAVSRAVPMSCVASGDCGLVLETALPCNHFN